MATGSAQKCRDVVSESVMSVRFRVYGAVSTLRMGTAVDEAVLGAVMVEAARQAGEYAKALPAGAKQTLLKILTNIVKDQGNPKYRRLRKSNAKIAEV